MKEIQKISLVFSLAPLLIGGVLFSNSANSKTNILEKNVQVENQIRKALAQDTANQAEQSVFEASNGDVPFDEQENNDSFDAANLISVAPLGKPIDYTVSRRGTLHQKNVSWFQTGVDEDFYRFDVYGKGSAVITLSNIPDNTCYDLDLFTFPNNKYASFNAIDSPTNYSHNSNNQNETILQEVVPGTYYAKVFSHNAQTFDNVNKYTLTVSVTYSYENRSISDLRYNKGAKAALWVSDYSPCGFYPFKSFAKEQIGSIDYYTTTDYQTDFTSTNIVDKDQNPFNKAIIAKTNGAQIRESTVYLWDKSWREQIGQKLRNDIIPALAAEKDAYEHDKITVQRIENTTSVIVDIVGFIPCVGTAISIISFVVDLASAEGLSLLPTFFPACDDIASESLYSFATNVEIAVDANSDTSSSEVVKIPTFYKMYTENTSTFLTNSSGCFADFVPSFDTTGYLYSEDVISAYQNDSVVNGTINILKTNADISNLFSGIYTYSCADVNTASPKTINVNSPDIQGGLNNGEYLWYRFAAPENAYYRFYTEGNGYQALECFYHTAPGRSTSGKLPDEYVAYDGHNAQISRKMYKNDVVFIRLHGVGWSSEPAFSFRVSQGQTFHVHAYTDHYVYWDNSYHRAYCACGENKLIRHGVDSTTTKVVNGVTMARCVDCGHWIDVSGGAIVADAIVVTPTAYTFSTQDNVLVLSAQDVEEHQLGYFSL